MWRFHQSHWIFEFIDTTLSILNCFVYLLSNLDFAMKLQSAGMAIMGRVKMD